MEIHRSTDTSGRPHCNFPKVTCGTMVHNYALDDLLLFKILRRSLVGERKMHEDFINTFISDLSEEGFVVNPLKKQNVLVSGLPMKFS